jgi:hypothetical protein
MAAYCGLGLDHSLVGKKEQKWTRIGPSFMVRGQNLGHRTRVVVCQCDCGSVQVMRETNIVSGRTSRCRLCAGVSRRVESLAGNDPAYPCWRSMRARCYDPSHVSYPAYGASGITVCDEWRGPGGFARFVEHIGPRPSSAHSVDRYPDNRGNYEPGNVRWATSSEQNRNRRSNHLVTYMGQTKCLMEWSEITGFSKHVLWRRLRLGWSAERALTEPKRY